MSASKNNFLDHVKLMRDAVLDRGAEFLIAGDSMQVLIRHRDRHFTLRPQFLAAVHGTSRYTSALTADATQFAGWSHGQARRWPVASDKLAFKRLAIEAGLAVPEFSVDPRVRMADVVVKRSASSFGEHVKGPFRSSTDCALDVAMGDYYERFVEGELIKVWYWNAAPVVMELDAMPFVTGDGATPLRVQIERRARLLKRQSPEWLRMLLERSRVVLDYFGASLDTALARGERQVIEFRYGSDLMHPGNRRVVDLRGNADPAWDALVAAGSILHRAIPAELRAHAMFTLDAVRDRNHRIWLLEMNSNPAVHPLLYPFMVGALIDAAPTNEATAEQVPVAMAG